MAADRHQPGAQSYYTRNGRASIRRIKSFPWSPYAILVISLTALVLARRSLFIALDDYNYYVQFSYDSDWYRKVADGKVAEGFEDWWLMILDETLWNIYSAAAGAIFGPEYAIRLTLFISAFAFLVASAKLAGGWGVTTFLFLFHPNMASQIYFNQIRQGVAVSLFLVISGFARLGKVSTGMLIASGVAALVHSSFLALFAATTFYKIGTVATNMMRIVLALAGVLAIVVLSQHIDIVELVDTGRRKGIYAMSGALNANFYIVFISAYASIFFLLIPARKAGLSEWTGTSDWYYLTLIFCVIAIGFTFVHQAGARLLYNLDAMLAILLAMNFRGQRGYNAFAIWCCALLITITSTHLRSTAASQESSLTRWELILFSRAD